MNEIPKEDKDWNRVYSMSDVRNGTSKGIKIPEAWFKDENRRFASKEPFNVDKDEVVLFVRPSLSKSSPPNEPLKVNGKTIYINIQNWENITQIVEQENNPVLKQMRIDEEKRLGEI